ncbi:hypothetical protein BKA64DRAFT_647849 [Cadophora sp. MPI-SDFR-AT-0126]|nr:hypothetical protein BKA64DRAFT_647849 [Leotiomycetes sp. MPI-SDFR-AT-0126]
MSGSPNVMETTSILDMPAPVHGIVRRATKDLSPNMQKELEILKERNKEDKRLKEKFSHINREPTWLLRHIELLQEAYDKDGWEYNIIIPEECQHRIRPSIIGSYLIFTRDKKGRKGKVTKEYIPVPLSHGASWGSWKQMDDDARLPTEGRLPYLPAPGPGEPKLYHGLLDHDLDAYLTAGEIPEDYEDYTIDGMGILPEDRPPRRRIVSKESSSSTSSVKVPAYSKSSHQKSSTSKPAPSHSIMESLANYAPDRSLRSTRKVSSTSVSSNSTNNSSTSSTNLMSNGMPVPGSIRKPKHGERSDSEGLEGGSDNGEDDEEDEEDDERHAQKLMQRALKGYNEDCRVIHNSDDEDEDVDEDEEDEDEYAVKPVGRNKGFPNATDLSGSDDAEDDRAVLTKSAQKFKKISNEIPEISPDLENDYDDETGSDENERGVEYEFGNMAGGYDIEEGYGEAVEDYEDDEWFDESGYCKFCDLHQHECECIRGDENDPMERGEDDDDYKN